MKMKLISMLLACIMLTSLAACADDNNNPGKAPEESTKETDVQTTEDVTTEEDTAEPTPELALNEDLLSDIGLTFPELVEKRGERNITKLIGTEGGHGYFFQNGYGAYVWGGSDLDYGPNVSEREGWESIPRDENGNPINENFPSPKSDVKCTCITHVQTKDFLLNISFPLKASDIERIEGVKDVRTGEEGIFTSFEYITAFVYKGCTIYIYHNDVETIDTNSMTEIFIDSNY